MRDSNRGDCLYNVCRSSEVKIHRDSMHYILLYSVVSSSETINFCFSFLEFYLENSYCAQTERKVQIYCKVIKTKNSINERLTVRC